MNAVSKPSNATVLTFGDPLIVLVPSARGKLEYVRDFRAYAAGAELNTAIGLARLDIPASYAAAIGDDPFGNLIYRELRAEGVDSRHVAQVPGMQSGIFFKQWSGLEQDPSVFYYRSQSPMALGAWDTESLRDAISAGTWQWVHTTGITFMVGQETGERSLELLKLCHSLSVVTSFDVNVRLKLAGIDKWRAMLRRVLPYVTWFMLGDDEAKRLFETKSVVAIETIAREWGFQGSGVVLKQGADGSCASVGGVTTVVPPRPVKQIVDTVGAGDGYNAGWIAGMVRGWSLARSMELASLVGAYAITDASDYGGYPRWQEVARDLEGGVDVSR